MIRCTKKNGFELSVLEHPKFKSLKVKGAQYQVIPYEKFAKTDLLQKYLSGFNLILTAGSSIALDCHNYNLNYMCTFIESKPIKYWLSVKRYTDSVEHFSDFIVSNRVKVLEDFNQVEMVISNLKSNSAWKSDRSTKTDNKSRQISVVLLETIHNIIQS